MREEADTFCLYASIFRRAVASEGRPQHSLLMSEKNLIGPKVRELRIGRGWSQAQLTAKLGERGWHCSVEDISNIEQGVKPVSDVQFLVLAIVLEVDPVELFPPDLAREIRRDKEPGLD